MLGQATYRALQAAFFSGAHLRCFVSQGDAAANVSVWAVCAGSRQARHDQQGKKNDGGAHGWGAAEMGRELDYYKGGGNGTTRALRCRHNALERPNIIDKNPRHASCAPMIGFDRKGAIR